MRAALGCGRAELLHKRQDRKQKMMCTVVVALGQLIVKHVVQMLQPHGLQLGQAAHRTRILRDQRIFLRSPGTASPPSARLEVATGRSGPDGSSCTTRLLKINRSPRRASYGVPPTK